MYIVVGTDTDQIPAQIEPVAMVGCFSQLGDARMLAVMLAADRGYPYAHVVDDDSGETIETFVVSQPSPLEDLIDEILTEE